MRNPRRALVLLFCWVGCAPSSKPSVNGATSPSEAAVSMTEPAVSMTEAAADPAPHDGTTVAQGPLQISKMNPVVQGWFLPHDELSERFGDDWRKRLENRRLRVRGVTDVYHCPPESQCLIGGKIPRFASVTELALLCADGRTLVVPRRCPSPRCLERCETKVMSRHDACGRNAGPNRPAWCADDNQEMRQNCEAACAADCKPQPDAKPWCD